MEREGPRKERARLLAYFDKQQNPRAKMRQCVYLRYIVKSPLGLAAPGWSLISGALFSCVSCAVTRLFTSCLGKDGEQELRKGFQSFHLLFKKQVKHINTRKNKQLRHHFKLCFGFLTVFFLSVYFLVAEVIPHIYVFFLSELVITTFSCYNSFILIFHGFLISLNDYIVIYIAAPKLSDMSVYLAAYK